jgi:hypothetical protein
MEKAIISLTKNSRDLKAEFGYEENQFKEFINNLEKSEQTAKIVY